MEMLLSTKSQHEVEQTCSECLSNIEVSICEGSTLKPKRTIGDATNKVKFEFFFDGIAGDEVKVQLKGTDFLHLAEVEACGTAIENLALEGTSSQSSMFYGKVASIAVDGNTNERSASHTKLESKPWWRVKLNGKAIIIKNLALTLLEIGPK